MEANKKTFIFAGIIILVLAVVIFIFVRKPAPTNSLQDIASSPTNQTPAPTATIAAGVANYWFDKDAHKVTFTNIPNGAAIKFVLSSEAGETTVTSVSANDTPDSIIIELQGKRIFTVGINWATTDEGFAIGSTKSIKNSTLGNIYRVSGKDYEFDNQMQYLPGKSVQTTGSCTAFDEEKIAAPCRNGNSQFEVVNGAQSIQYGLYCDAKDTATLTACDSIVSGVRLE